MSDAVTYIDLLTGAYVRGHFEELLAKAVARAQKEGRPLSIIRFDVDETQEHNDLHGQSSVDQALSWLATRISQLIDGKGPLGRIAGDEFAVFLDGVPQAKALEIANGIRKMIPRTTHSSAFGDYQLTVSIGVAALKAGEPWGNLYDAAEAAVTRAKQGGRDSVAAR